MILRQQSISAINLAEWRSAAPDSAIAGGAISVADLNAFRLWIETGPEVPEGEWYKDFGTFKICGRGYTLEPFCFVDKVAKGAAL